MGEWGGLILPGPQKYVKIMALRAILRGLGLLCYILLGFRYGERTMGFGLRV